MPQFRHGDCAITATNSRRKIPKEFASRSSNFCQSTQPPYNPQTRIKKKKKKNWQNVLANFSERSNPLYNIAVAQSVHLTHAYVRPRWCAVHRRVESIIIHASGRYEICSRRLSIIILTRRFPSRAQVYDALGPPFSRRRA